MGHMREWKRHYFQSGLANMIDDILHKENKWNIFSSKVLWSDGQKHFQLRYIFTFFYFSKQNKVPHWHFNNVKRFSMSQFIKWNSIDNCSAFLFCLYSIG